ncbi:MAG: thymidylate synthase, partial [Marinomonas sp.]
AALLTRMIAHHVKLEPGELVWMGGDVHLYLNHAHLIEEQLTREPQGSPTLEIARKPKTIFDYQIGDFVVHDYAPLPAIKAPVAV